MIQILRGRRPLRLILMLPLSKVPAGRRGKGSRQRQNEQQRVRRLRIEIRC